VREETQFAICESPIMPEHGLCSAADRDVFHPPPHRIPDLKIHQNERILRAPAFERSQHEFTRDTPEQRVGMAKPVPGKWLAVQNLRCLPGDWPAV
jgi:hypothetical protein